MSITAKPDYEKQLIDINKGLLNRLISNVDENKEIADKFNTLIEECVKFAQTGDVYKISNQVFSQVGYLVKTVEGGEEYFKNLDVNNIDVEVYKKLLFFFEQWKSGFERAKEYEIEQTNKYARLQAEFENYKKRVHKEKTLLESQSKYNAISGILDIIDDLELAKKNEPDNEGVKLIFDKLNNYLEKQGVEEVDCSGEFNEDLHECLTVVNMGEAKKNQIIEVVSKGYIINGHIVRYPKVVVAK
jgi:molecular chaperone GrpE